MKTSNDLGVPDRAMFQPEAKLEFVRRYCNPQDGWIVFVDIDPSEEGRTGGEPRSAEARGRRRRMQQDAVRVRRVLAQSGATIGGSRPAWFEDHGLPKIEGDRDIIAFHRVTHTCLIAEVEGDSSGQPEQKLYRAIGQLVTAVGQAPPNPWRTQFVLVVVGEHISAHLKKANALAELGITGLALGRNKSEDKWLFTQLEKRINVQQA